MQAPKIPPQLRVQALYKAFCAEPAQKDLITKRKAMGIVLAASSSLPVVTIATRDRIELEMKARRQADLNRAEAELAVARASAETQISPEHLDG